MLVRYLVAVALLTAGASVRLGNHQHRLMIDQSRVQVEEALQEALEERDGLALEAAELAAPVRLLRPSKRPPDGEALR